MSIQNLDERIEIAKGGVSKYGISVASGTEMEKPRSLASRGQEDGTVPSALSAEAELAERKASRQFRDTGGAAQEIHMPDSSEHATDANSVKVGSLTVWLSDDGSFWDNFGASVNPNLKVYVQGEDGQRLEVSGAGAIPLMTELKKMADAAKSKKAR